MCGTLRILFCVQSADTVPRHLYCVVSAFAEPGVTHTPDTPPHIRSLPMLPWPHAICVASMWGMAHADVHPSPDSRDTRVLNIFLWFKNTQLPVDPPPMHKMNVCDRL